MKPKYFLILFFLLSFSIAHLTFNITYATVRYVSKSGTSTPPYTSWETAADSIQKAVNIADVGDTIYVANGVYYESIYIDKTINLWGSSMDSTIIDGTNIIGYDIVTLNENNSTLKNFTIISAIQQRNGINSFRSNIKAEFFQINNLTIPLLISSSSVSISNFIINAFNRGIRDECFPDTCHSIYTNNIIISRYYNGETPVLFSYGGYPVFSNNILIEKNPGNWDGIYAQTSGAVIKNNIISGFYDSGIDLYPNRLTAVDSIYNNVITDMVQYGIQTSPGYTARIRNNIFQRNGTGLISYSSPARLDYNLFWNVQRLVYNQPFIGDSNIIADPMFLNDTLPRIGGTYDYHLQKYSPTIDKGDPNILDKDGSRSDIGMYGGPFGETYTYQDLAPLAPRNLSAIVNTNLILVKWNKNTEADTAFYRVYRDTVINFTIDPTKLISSQTDTFFVHLPPYNSSKYVNKITCVDKQGNESQPSIELVVNITSVSTNEYPMTISDYILYQNYPNPFNPSTKIGYQLKERGYVKLMVYDIKGELVSVLVNKEQNAGYYEAEFSSSHLVAGSIQHPESSINGLASGIYLYRIEVIGEGNIPVYTEMKKMLMIK